MNNILLIFPINLNNNNNNELYFTINNNIIIPSIINNKIDIQKIDTVLNMLFLNKLNYDNYFFYNNGFIKNKSELNNLLLKFNNIILIDDELLFNN